MGTRSWRPRNASHPQHKPDHVSFLICDAAGDHETATNSSSRCHGATGRTENSGGILQGCPPWGRSLGPLPTETITLILVIRRGTDRRLQRISFWRGLDVCNSCPRWQRQWTNLRTPGVKTYKKGRKHTYVLRRSYCQRTAQQLQQLLYSCC